MKTGLLYLLIAVVLISGGTAVYYLYGYRDNTWIKGCAYMLMVFGWVFIFFDMLLIYPAALDSPAKKETADKSLLPKMKRVLFFTCFFAWMLALIFNFFIAEEWMQSRVSTILSTQPTTPATAEVMKIEDRKGRINSHYFAIIRYTTPKGDIMQAIADDNEQYRQGQNIEIRYSNTYPDMFSVVSAR